MAAQPSPCGREQERKIVPLYIQVGGTDSEQVASENKLIETCPCALQMRASCTVLSPWSWAPNLFALLPASPLMAGTAAGIAGTHSEVFI